MIQSLYPHACYSGLPEAGSSGFLIAILLIFYAFRFVTRLLVCIQFPILEFERERKKNYSKSRYEEYRPQYIISKAQLFTKTNYNKDIKIGDVAKAVYISSTQKLKN